MIKCIEQRTADGDNNKSKKKKMIYFGCEYAVQEHVSMSMDTSEKRQLLISGNLFSHNSTVVVELKLILV